MTTALALDDPKKLCQQLADVAQQCVEQARASGASGAEAGVSTSAGLSVTARNGEVETIEHIRDKGVGLTVYFGQRKGTASTSDFSAEAIADTVEAACQIAKLTGEDEHSGLADAELMATDFPDLDLYHPWREMSAERAIELAVETEQAGLAVDERIVNSDGATLGSHETSHAYVNSHGFVGVRNSTRHSLSCRLIGEDRGRTHHRTSVAWRRQHRSVSRAVTARGGIRFLWSLRRRNPRRRAVPEGYFPAGQTG